jgi:hypothetical protein
MSPPSKRPWYMFYPLAGMIIICIVWSGYWYVAFTQTEKLVAEQRTAFGIKGVNFSCDHETWGGYPFRFEFQCDGMHLNYAGNTLETRKVLAIAQAYNPLHLLFLVDGPTSIGKGEKTVATATHNDALISIIFMTNGDWDLSSDVANVVIPQQFAAKSLRFFARQINGGIEFAGNLNSASIYTGVPLDTAAFKARSASQASIELTQLKISSGKTTFEGVGNFELDSNHRIAGKLMTQTNDIDGLLKLMAPLLQLNNKDQAAIGSLIAAQNPNPASPAQKAEFIGRDGAIYWGPFKLADTTPLY